MTYQVKIDTTILPHGEFVGTLWSWSDTNGVTYNATNLAPVNQLWVPLNNGIEARFDYGNDSPNFVTGDVWVQTFFRRHPLPALLDLSRDTEMRTGPVLSGGSVDWTASFASAKAVPAVIVFDHNFPAGSTILFQTSNVSNFASLTSNVTIPYAAQKLYHIVASPVSALYARLRVTSGAAMPYLRMSNLYFGSVTTMSKEFKIGFDTGIQNHGPLDIQTMIRGQAPLGGQGRFYNLIFPMRLDTAGQDIDLLEQLWVQLHTPVSMTKRPCFFVQDTVAPLMFELCHWNADRFSKEHVFLSRYNAPVPLLGLARTAA